MNAVKWDVLQRKPQNVWVSAGNTRRKLVEWGKPPVLKVGHKTIIRRDIAERFLTVNQEEISLKPDDVRRGNDHPFFSVTLLLGV